MRHHAVEDGYEIARIAVLYYQGAVDAVPLVGGLLTQKEWADRAAPLLVLVVFTWILVEVGLHARRIWVEQSVVRQMQGSLRSVASRSSGRTRGERRARLLLQHAGSAPEQTRDAVGGAAAMDADALENSYGLTRAYVWILPVLGFIGTAWGMAHAIGGFSEALKETREVSVLADRLGQLVIPGLSNAFATTMLALATAIVAHFCVTTVQSWDLAVLHQLDEVSLASLSTVAGGSSARLEQVLVAIQATVEQLSRTSSQFADGVKILLQTSRELHAAGQQIEQGAHSLRDAMKGTFQVTVDRS